jgi:hypothetical protein
MLRISDVDPFSKKREPLRCESPEQMTLSEIGTTASRFRDILARRNSRFPEQITLAYPLLSAQPMKKLHTLCCLFLATITLALTSCATQPQTSATSNSNSPMERQNGNGLASAMH